MFLNLKELSDSELYDKMSTLQSRLRHLNQYSSYSDMHNQCVNFLEQIRLEMEDRAAAQMLEEEKSGSVSIIGENTEDDDKK